jgi:hypothetical protein
MLSTKMSSKRNLISARRTLECKLPSGAVQKMVQNVIWRNLQLRMELISLSCVLKIKVYVIVELLSVASYHINNLRLPRQRAYNKNYTVFLNCVSGQPERILSLLVPEMCEFYKIS